VLPSRVGSWPCTQILQQVLEAFKETNTPAYYHITLAVDVNVLELFSSLIERTKKFSVFPLQVFLAWANICWYDQQHTLEGGFKRHITLLGSLPTWEMLAKYKHSSLFVLFFNDEEKVKCSSFASLSSLGKYLLVWPAAHTRGRLPKGAQLC